MHNDVMVWLAVFIVSSIGGLVGAIVAISIKATWLAWRKRLEGYDPSPTYESTEAWHERR